MVKRSLDAANAIMAGNSKSRIASVSMIFIPATNRDIRHPLVAASLAPYLNSR